MHILLKKLQKARINLARALYTNSPICLMDDILSAVDAKVSRQLFENCILGLLKNRLRVLVTHQLQYLQYADHIIVMQDVRTFKLIKLFNLFCIGFHFHLNV